ncbi:MAG: CPBP family glutamic-type intramembrane protease [Deltaproteobacteria bacterium]|nr:CPBP family glutamic-type intramembrane protease [Deltaproteobacteria bacterium]MCL5792922.1 CPBP family glutamic-type intramembrane protease [Deltaproteobacteria bacterium]
MKRCKTPYIVYVVSMAVIAVARYTHALDQYLGTIAAVLFLYIPVMILFIKKKSPELYGLGKKGMLSGMIKAIAMVIIIFPLYSTGFYFYMKWFYHLAMTLSFIHTLSILRFAFYDLLMVAIPEEVFYRGYLQSELKRCDRKKFHFAGIEIGVSFVIVNILFALGHLIVIQDIARLAVFFPGLVFSWLKEKDYNISGSVTFHWLSNVLSFLLFSMLR